MKGGKSMVFKSDHDVNTLKERWDDKTAFKNFAGGDDYLDNVFISRRYGSIVCLKSKPLSAHNLFGAVYWGYNTLQKRRRLKNNRIFRHQPDRSDNHRSILSAVRLNNTHGA